MGTRPGCCFSGLGVGGQGDGLRRGCEDFVHVLPEQYGIYIVGFDNLRRSSFFDDRKYSIVNIISNGLILTFIVVKVANNM